MNGLWLLLKFILCTQLYYHLLWHCIIQPMQITNCSNWFISTWTCRNLKQAIFRNQDLLRCDLSAHYSMHDLLLSWTHYGPWYWYNHCRIYDGKRSCHHRKPDWQIRYLYILHGPEMIRQLKLHKHASVNKRIKSIKKTIYKL